MGTVGNCFNNAIA